MERVSAARIIHGSYTVGRRKTVPTATRLESSLWQKKGSSGWHRTSREVEGRNRAEDPPRTCTSDLAARLLMNL
jgi:hypothetical protein